MSEGEGIHNECCNRAINAQTNQPLGVPTLRRASLLRPARCRAQPRSSLVIVNLHRTFLRHSWSYHTLSRSRRIASGCVRDGAVPLFSDSYASLRMSTQSRSQVIQSKPIGKGLDSFRNTFNSICNDIDVPSSSQALDKVGYEGSTS
jgi:hypothetical protein